MEIPGPPLSLQDDEKKVVVGVYKCPAQSQTWERVGKGFASLKFHPITGLVYLFACATAGTDILCQVPLTATVQVFKSEETSLEWQEPGSPRMAFSFQDPTMCFDLYTRASNVITAEKLIRDKSGKTFWHSTSGFSTQIEWNQFVNGIIAWFKTLEKGDMTLLTSCLRITPTQQLVSLETFAGFLSRFGKMEDVLPNMRSIMSQSWFQGFASREQAEQYLYQQNKPGAFLVRFSATQPGFFALSYLDADRSIKHVLIEPNDIGDGYLLQCAGSAPLRYRTLIELVNAEKERFVSPYFVSQPHKQIAMSAYDLRTSSRVPAMKVAVYYMDPGAESWSIMLPAGYVTHSFDSSRMCHLVQVDPETPVAQQPLSFEITQDIQVSCDNPQTVTWMQKNGQRLGLSFVYSEGASELWTKLSTKKAVTVDQQASEVFSLNGWAYSSTVPFTDFISGLRRVCNDQAFDELVDYIKYIVFYNRGEDERVSLEDVMRLLAWFGPCVEFVQRLQQAVHEPWFHWFVTREQAEQMLHNMHPGTFLVRFSSDKRSFALSLVEKYDGQQSFVHALLSRTFRASGSSFSMTSVGGKEIEFQTLPELIRLEQERLRYPCSRLQDEETVQQ